MAMTFAQTGSGSAACSGTVEKAGCSGRTSSITSAVDLECLVGGTAGTVPITAGITSGGTNLCFVFFACVVPAGTSGDSGTWTTRLNVTTANMNLTVTEIYVCRASSDCTNQETIGSATGLSISLGSTGVKTQTVSGSAVTLSAGDLVTVVYVGTNGAMTDQTIQFTPDQNIDSPFTEPAPDRRQPPVNRSFAVMRASNY